MLDEFRQPVGILLWQTLADAHLWTTSRPEARPKLFAEGALDRRLARLRSYFPAGELLARLSHLATLVMAETPADGKPVAAECGAVAELTKREGRLGTALGFAQAAALADPTDPDAALATALLALQREEVARAESWLRRAVVIGRHAGSTQVQATAHLELGHMYARRGVPSVARRFYLLALRRSRRGALTHLVGAAAHGLFDLSLTAAPEEVDSFARTTLRAYRAAHPRAAELLRAWVRFRAGRDSSAPILGQAGEPLPFEGRDSSRAFLLAVMARAAAACGARGEFERAWAAAWRLIDRIGHRGGSAERVPTLLELGRAAMALERWQLAEYAGQQALDAALGRRRVSEREEAEEFLRSLWERTGGMGAMGPPEEPEIHPREEPGEVA